MKLDIKHNQVTLACYAAVCVAACVARDEKLPSLPRRLPPRPEECMHCGAKHSLVTMKQVCEL